MSTSELNILFSALDSLLASQFPNFSPSSTLTSLGTPSASIAVLTSSGIITHTIANTSSPTNPDTLFQACSISKPICGLAVLRTIDQGKLSFDDAITKHLPVEYIDAISTPATRKLLDHLTIRNLISHTGGTSVSGFPGYDCNGPVASVKAILQGSAGSNTPQIRLNRFPGLKWRYSGGGLTLVHVTLEAIHGKPFPEIMKELVFGPLGMTRSFYSLPDDETNFAQCWSTGVTESAPARWHIQPELGAAGLWTTPGDLMRAQRGIRGSAVGNSNFLNKVVAMEGLTAVDGANGWTSGGWQSAKGWFGHGGSNNPGFRCQTLATWNCKGEALEEMDGEGVAVMTNSALGTNVCQQIILAVSYLRGWPGRVALSEMGNAAVPLGDPREDVGEGWKGWMGEWELGVEEGDAGAGKGQVLVVEGDGAGGPSVRLGDLPGFRLVKAAIAAVDYGDDCGEGIDLVVEGLDMMLVLGYGKGKERTLEIWPGFTEEPIKCERR